MFEHLDKLQALEDRYIDLEAKISDPSVISDQAQWQKYTKAHAKLTDVVETYRAYQKLQKTYDDDQALLEMGESDEELAASGQRKNEGNWPRSWKTMKAADHPPSAEDPNDEKEHHHGNPAPVPAMKRPFAGDLSACTPAMPKPKGGAWNSWIPVLRAWWFKEVIFMVSAATSTAT